MIWLDTEELECRSGTVGAGTGCYDNLVHGQGDATQTPPIATAGQIAVDVIVPDAAQLAQCDVLFTQNSANADYGAEWATLFVLDTRHPAGSS